MPLRSTIPGDFVVQERLDEIDCPVAALPLEASLLLDILPLLICAREL